MNCKTCAYFHDTETECRRYAPQPAEGSSNAKASWPTVAASDWCGEYKSEKDAGKTAAA